MSSWGFGVGEVSFYSKFSLALLIKVDFGLEICFVGVLGVIGETSLGLVSSTFIISFTIGAGAGYGVDYLTVSSITSGYG